MKTKTIITTFAAGMIAVGMLASFGQNPPPRAWRIAEGGTGATTDSGARTALGLAIGTNVQAYDADLTTWAGVTPGTGVTTALGNAVNSASGALVLDSNADIPLGSHLVLADGGGATNSPNFLNNPAFNSIESGCVIAYILGGSVGNTCHIGKNDATPSDPGGITDWTNDTGYVSGAADVTSIIGGYDNINNSIGSHMFGCNHCYIKYNVNGHMRMSLSTYSLISQPFGVIVGGEQSQLTNGTGGGIFNSHFSSITGCQYADVIGGYNGDIDTANYSIISALRT